MYPAYPLSVIMKYIYAQKFAYLKEDQTQQSGAYSHGNSDKYVIQMYVISHFLVS